MKICTISAKKLPEVIIGKINENIMFKCPPAMFIIQLIMAIKIVDQNIVTVVNLSSTVYLAV